MAKRVPMKYLKHIKKSNWFKTPDTEIYVAMLDLIDGVITITTTTDFDKYDVHLTVNAKNIDAIPYSETGLSKKDTDYTLRKMHRNVRTAMKNADRGDSIKTVVLERALVADIYRDAIHDDGAFYDDTYNGALKAAGVDNASNDDDDTATADDTTTVDMSPSTDDIDIPAISPDVAPKSGLGIDDFISNSVYRAIASEHTDKLMKATADRIMREAGIVPHSVRLTITRPDLNDVTIDNPHKTFPKVLKALSAGVHVALVGPAGSGKSYAVKMAADVLDLRFFSKSVSAETGNHEFFGYMDANGNYVDTPFREAFENGGVFLLDEFDNGNPNVLAALNAAVANDVCSFADGMVDKHEDFLCVMTGNTYGNGATSEYVGRNPIDGATLDRFAFIFFGYDERLERTLAGNDDWVDTVHKLRETADKKDIRAIISPRASINGAKLLAAGLDRDDVLDMVVFKGLEREEVDMLRMAI